MSSSAKPSVACRPWRGILLSALIVAVIAGIVNWLIATIAIALGVSPDDSHGLEPFSFVPLTVIGAIAGAVGWHLVNRFAPRPGRVFRWLVPVVLLVSFTPDIYVALDTGWPNALALMAMHTLTVVIGVLVYRRLMPITRP